MITNFQEDFFWGVQYLRDDKTGEREVRVFSGVEREDWEFKPVCTLNISREDWEFNSMLILHATSAFEIVRRVALDDIDEEDAQEIRATSRRIMEFLQKEHDKLTKQ